jgi:hypothetical protein
VLQLLEDQQLEDFLLGEQLGSLEVQLGIQLELKLVDFQWAVIVKVVTQQGRQLGLLEEREPDTQLAYYEDDELVFHELDTQLEHDEDDETVS